MSGGAVCLLIAVLGIPALAVGLLGYFAPIDERPENEYESHGDGL